jgi:Mn-dependent DtxR family transcriptional regulator
MVAPKKSDGRLGALKRAHGAAPSGVTPRVEDYVEVIYELIFEKGYARIVDVSQHLHVASPTVTKMIQRLHDEGLVVYERYRGVVLTPEGTALAKEVRRRHGLLTQFLRLLGVDEPTAHRDTEGIEHHLDASTLERIERFVEFAEQNPQWIAEFRKSAESKRR